MAIGEELGGLFTMLDVCSRAVCFDTSGTKKGSPTLLIHTS